MIMVLLKLYIFPSGSIEVTLGVNRSTQFFPPSVTIQPYTPISVSFRADSPTQYCDKPPLNVTADSNVVKSLQLINNES